MSEQTISARAPRRTDGVGPVLSGGRGQRAFTLIELLVVVAIIALLISILLPSLSRARAQARTTLCLSRLGQLGRAFLIYSEDYGGSFPFISTMHERFDEGADPEETWLADWLSFDDPEAALATVGYEDETDWGDLRQAVPRSGIIFPYTRFAALYACPDFVRQQQSAQHVFNYTRAMWARYWRMPEEYEEMGRAAPSDWGGLDGPIMKVSRIHSPAELPMLLDEQWNRHVGTAGREGSNDSAYNCGDYGFYGDNNIAVVHGQPVTSRFHTYDYGMSTERFGKDPFVWPRGGIFCYDSHAELRREPWPCLPLGNNTLSKPFRLGHEGPRLLDEMKALPEYMRALLFAQRGFDPQEAYGNPPVPW